MKGQSLLLVPWGTISFDVKIVSKIAYFGGKFDSGILGEIRFWVTQTLEFRSKPDVTCSVQVPESSNDTRVADDCNTYKLKKIINDCLYNEINNYHKRYSVMRGRYISIYVKDRSFYYYFQTYNKKY